MQQHNVKLQTCILDVARQCRQNVLANGAETQSVTGMCVIFYVNANDKVYKRHVMLHLMNSGKKQ